MTSLITRGRRRVATEIAYRQLSSTAKQITTERLTYLSVVRLRQIETALEWLEHTGPHTDPRFGVSGGIVEMGVALGGSAALLARHAVRHERTFDGYDTFGMIPAPGGDDPPAVHERYRVIVEGRSHGIGADDPYYGYRDDLLEHVTATLARYGAPVGPGIRLHKGLFEDMLQPAGEIAFAHIDCDWYDPVRLCLERIYPHLSPGAIVVIDDYYDYGGARKATDEFLASHDNPMDIFADNSHLILKLTRWTPPTSAAF
jgi:O-methyltransferase